MKYPSLVVRLHAGIMPAILLLGLLLVPCSASPETGRTAASGSPPACITIGWPWDHSDLRPDPALVHGTLDNGLRYVIMANHEPRGRVALYLDVQAGSLYETDEQRGLAHFLEHMLFNGTTHYPPGTLVKYFQSLGMGFGADSNAHTGYDETVYNLLLPGNSEEDLDKGMLVLADYARGALLLEEEVDRERGVILAEKRARDSAGTRVAKKRFRFEFAGTRAAVRDPIGTEESLRAADSARLRAYYDAWYRPDNMIVVVVGDADPVLVRKVLARHFSKLRAAPVQPVCPPFGRVAEQGTDVLYLHEPDLGYTEVSLETVWNTEPRADTRAWEARQLTRYVAASILDNRLSRLVTEKESPLTRTRVYSGIFVRRLGYCFLGGRVDGDRWQEALTLLETTLRQALEYGFTADELVRVRKEIMAELEKEARTADSRDSRKIAAMLIRKLNSGEVPLSPQQELKIYGQMLAEMDLDDVNDAFRELWNHKRRLVMVAGTAKIGNGRLPPEQEIRKVLATAAALPVSPWVAESRPGFPYLPVPAEEAAVKEHVRPPGIGADIYTLDNGLVLNVKQTDFRKSEVLVAVHFGSGLLTEPKPGLARLAESVVAESGVGGLTREQLDRALAGSSVRLNFRVGEESFAFNGKGLNTELELLLQLLQAHLADPAFRPEAYRLAMERYAQMYSRMRNSVEGMLQLRGERFLAGGDSRYGMPPWQEFRRLGLDDVRNWLQPAFTRQQLEITVVGDVTSDAVLDLVRKYFGSGGRDLTPSARGRAIGFPVGRELDITVHTAIDKALIVVAWPTADFWDISRTRRLNVLASVLEDRLRREVREELGATYSPVVYNRSSRVDPGYGVLRAMLTVAPDHAEELVARIRAAGARLAGEGVDRAELSRALKPTLTSIRDMMRQNRYWRDSVLALSSRHPVQLRWPLSIRRDFAAITAPEISRLAARYLQTERAARIVIRPAAE